MLEKGWLFSNIPHNIILYNRFIDDIFIIAKSDIILSNFKLIFSNLILNIIFDKQIKFLLFQKINIWNPYLKNYILKTNLNP